MPLLTCTPAPTPVFLEKLLYLFYRSELSSVFNSFFLNLFIIFLVAFRWLPKREGENGELILQPEISLKFLMTFSHLHRVAMRAPHIFSHYYSLTYPLQVRAKTFYITTSLWNKSKKPPFLSCPTTQSPADVVMLAVYVGMDPFLYITVCTHVQSTHHLKKLHKWNHFTSPFKKFNVTGNPPYKHIYSINIKWVFAMRLVLCR